MSIPKRIQTVLDETGLTKAEVSRRMKSSPNTLYELLRSSERCEAMSVESARKLAKALGVSIAWLLEGQRVQSVSDYPEAYGEWLKTPEGASATPGERSMIRSSRVESEPTVSALSMLLAMNRLQRSPDDRD